MPAAGVTRDRAHEGAVVARTRRQLLRYVAGALAVEVAVNVVGEARDRDRVDRRGVLDLDVEVAVPPGSGSEVGVADFVTTIELARLEIVTVASSSPLTGLPSSSVPEAVTTSRRELPALPATAPEKKQPQLAPAAIVCGTSHVPLPSRFP